MGSKKRPRKLTDYECGFSFAGGIGILREEVWVDDAGAVVRYNLAFVAPQVTRKDHGRILGYDNAHGNHERHCMGEASPVEFPGFPALTRRFYREVSEIRSKHEAEDHDRRG